LYLARASKTGMASLGQMRSHFRDGSRAIMYVETDARKLVVVLDDDAAMLHAIERGLRVRGYRTAGFSEVPDFLSSPGLGEAICLVLDINLKQASGIDVACQLKRMGHAVPVIFIIASDSEQTHRAAVGAGCIAYLTKPFRLENLGKAIEQRPQNHQSSRKRLVRCGPVLLPISTPALRKVEVSRHQPASRPQTSIHPHPLREPQDASMVFDEGPADGEAQAHA
jgi:FixJ family two-component response regulator